MTAFLIRRILYAFPVLFGVNVLVFALFFWVNSPDKIALTSMGGKRTTPEEIDRFKRAHKLDLPYLYHRGWRRIGSLGAAETENRATFPIAGPGHYRLVLESPDNEKIVIEAGPRRVRVTCSAPDRLDLGPAFDADGRLEAVPDMMARQFPFAVREGAGPDATLTVELGIDKPGLLHRVALEFQDEIPVGERFTRTLFWQHSVKMLLFDYGTSLKDRPIGREVRLRMIPSLTITVPAFVCGIAISIFFAMILAFYRGTYVDYWGVVLCVVLMSVSGMFYIIGVQLLSGRILRLFPISGFEYSLDSWRFVLMPILIAVVAGLGGSVRFYRTIFLEEINKDYVRTARAKGLPERTVLFVHVLKNAMIPILTNVVVSLPLLIMGSLVLESFFSIPGLGSYLLDGIRSQDFFIVQAIVSLGSFLYVIGLLLTDISYTLVDPRVRLE